MTHPIHSADAERAAFEAAMNDARFLPRELNFARGQSPSGRDEYINSHLQSCWKGWQARAAAQVGANGAADLPIDLKWDDKVGGYVSQQFTLSDIAAGAPAETIEQARANFENWYVTHIDGAVIGGADCAARWSSWLAGSTGQYKAPSDWKIAPMPWGAPAETPKPVEAWLYTCQKPGQHTVYASVDENDTHHWPLDQWKSLEKAPLVRATPAATIGAGEGKDAARDVLTERQRQMEIEGWTHEVDDQYTHHEMPLAAACYATGSRVGWPWSKYWWKPGTDRRNLVKAGALIIAEIERLDRAAMRSKTSPGEAG